MKSNYFEQFVKTNELKNLLANRMSGLELNHEVIAVDIADISESSLRILEIVKNALDQNYGCGDWQDSLLQIELEVEHLIWHYKSFKKQINK